jgi:hypothetical protein
MVVDKSGSITISTRDIPTNTKNSAIHLKLLILFFSLYLSKKAAAKSIINSLENSDG